MQKYKNKNLKQKIKPASLAYKSNKNRQVKELKSTYIHKNENLPTQRNEHAKKNKPM